ncbi:SH3 domain-containing protein [Mesonia algae]|uniref:SH3 domain-containing protein n=1 Tax=Mesonia algae TaxID=213248 RepID=A0A2W7IZ17_9FLAO|nr:M23 family metallopeptidase [Mesonia algae]PZW43913.1 SH3 domain-containing protein [Mesonia algae]
MKNFLSLISVTILIFVGFISCTKISEVLSSPTARETYHKEFKNRKAVIDKWQSTYSNATLDSIDVNLPYSEKGAFSYFQNKIYTYSFPLQRGISFTAKVSLDSLQDRVFINFFKKNDTLWEEVLSNNIQENTIIYTPKENGEYKIIIQPEIASSSNFFIQLHISPTYYFPVAGKDNKAIQSFWGNPRDGGKRSHEGIDIFASRGTPTVAVTDGRITRTGNRGLGGKQVWLKESLFGNSIYYAHLDSILVNNGDRVKVGDTLGLVGNSGNARTTVPHLHFGIYRNKAIDPLPFVYKTKSIQKDDFSKSFEEDYLVIKTARANLRSGPSTSNKIIANLFQNDTIKLLGQHYDWLHIKTTYGKVAFLHKSLVEKLK